MKIHILGICGTFMGGLAQILKDSGHDVSGSDMQFYPPMSEHLDALKIYLIEGYALDNLPEADLYVIGNALSRGNESVEHILNNRLPFKSGPEMLGEILRNRKVFAVSGTHGKTTTSYMLTHILKSSGRDIGYLVGGISNDIDGSASLGTDEIFVIEADEYDSAFFDKRSKFIHYHPKTLLINNLEFDHADIFSSLSDIKKQFHHLLRLMSSKSTLIFPEHNINIKNVMKMGFYSQSLPFNTKFARGWHAKKVAADSSKFDIFKDKKKKASISWSSIGEHSLQNGLASYLVCKSLGLKSKDIAESLSKFKGVTRRMDLVGDKSSVKVYDDFAHHPTAIKYTLEGLRKKVGSEKIICLLEMRSNTMLSGYHDKKIPKAVASADQVFIFSKDKKQISALESGSKNIEACSTTQEFLRKLSSLDLDNTHLICLSNGSFDGIHQAILERI